MPKQLFMRSFLTFTLAIFQWVYEKMSKIFSMGMACPKFQMVFVDLKTHSMHQTRPCCEYEEHFSKS